MSLPEYPEYKDSGVEWLGSLPVHWDVAPLKRGFDVRLGKMLQPTRSGVDDLFAPYLRAANIQWGGVDLADVKKMWFSRRESEELFLKEGDLLVSEGGDVGRAALWRLELEHCFIQNSVNRVRSRGRNSTAYLYYWIATIKSKGYIDVLCNKSTIAHFTAEKVEAVPTPFPRFDEQARIASFLDRETAKIDALIAEQEKLLTLLAEKRQATISHAVTRGIDPNAPMEDSGIPWLGEVPAHWDVMALGRITISKCDGPFGSGLKSDHYVDAGARVIRLQNIRGGRFDDRDSAFIDLGYFESELARHAVHEGDLLIAGLGDDNNVVGRACVAPADIHPALVKADCFCFRLDTEQIIPEFAAWALTVGAPYDAGTLSSGSTRARIPLTVMAARKIPLPPVSEQIEIARRIQAMQSEFDQLMSVAEEAIELLRERRSALIAAAVTGQIDVRGSAEAQAA